MGSQRNYVCARIGPGCDNGHTFWIHLGSVGWRTSLYFGIFQIPFSFGIVGTAEATGLTVSELKEKGPSETSGEMVRVGGTVLDGSIQYNSEEGNLHFTVTDGESRLPVGYEEKRWRAFLVGYWRSESVPARIYLITAKRQKLPRLISVQTCWKRLRIE